MQGEKGECFHLRVVEACPVSLAQCQLACPLHAQDPTAPIQALGPLLGLICAYLWLSSYFILHAAARVTEKGNASRAN